MNELAKITPFLLEGRQYCEIVDNKGDPWFVARDVFNVLGIKRIGHVLDNFPENEKAYVICEVHSKHLTSAVYSKHLTSDVGSTDGTYRRCDITSKHGTSGKSRARKTQKILIINESGVMRLILKSRKENAWVFKERIIKLVADHRKHGLNWAALPRILTYRGKEYTWAEWVNKQRESYFKRFPDASEEQFLATLPG